MPKRLLLRPTSSRRMITAQAILIVASIWGTTQLLGYAATQGSNPSGAAASDDAQAEPTGGQPVESPPREESPPAKGSQEQSSAAPPKVSWYALMTLAIGITIVLGLIIGLKLNAFLALITAAMVVSLLSSGDLPDRVSRVAAAFGTRTGQIGLVIAMAAVIGKCMLDSGSADRIVRSMLAIFGDRLAPLALMVSGFILAVPVFFDTVFYLLVPLARSLYTRTGKNYLLYILAIAAGGAITHTLVPPTPGPTYMAAEFGFKLGVMIMVGTLVAAPAALAGVIFSLLCNRWMPLPMRSISTEPEPEPLPDDQLPPLWLSLLPVVLPVILISANTILATRWHEPSDLQQQILDVSSVLGNPGFALMISTAIALLTLTYQRAISKHELAKTVEISLMSGGVIILITAAGGAFGDMLKVAGVGDTIQAVFSSSDGTGMSGMTLLLLGFGLAMLLKIAQGSSTVAMITGSAMLADFAGQGTLPFHPVYLACAVGAGSLMGSWMNDSGFWIFTKMGGLTEVESLKSWTILLVVMAVVSFGMTLILSQTLPLVEGAAAGAAMLP